MSEIIKDNDKESQRDKANADSTKLDSDDDEIIWESKKSKIGLILYCGIRIIATLFISYFVIPKILTIDNSFGKFLGIAVFILYYLLVIKDVFFGFNYKGLYLTKDKIVVTYHFTKDTIWKFGSFYVYYYIPANSPFVVISCDYGFTTWNRNNTLYVPDILIGNIDVGPFFHKIYELMKPHLIEYMLSLDDEEYIKARKPLKNIEKLTYLDEIDKMRKEQGNGK
ncbi:hypothetical protein CQA53_11025 [Helicobacter didelphidarum]|uniref:Uncharacterized protein n=1 Tax=Helicobacter didelphidarum TaxID=2040648 RepID=A0A3D8I519_9HELI|nr:hypothetical protein [Helicobacter didelphidarum]RDU60207.1 hypothetical protein CQA53_11025 [Helicobacter didelphidarum]